MSGPAFPPEIEYIIFTDALQLKKYDEDTTNLILVAKRCHTW